MRIFISVIITISFITACQMHDTKKTTSEYSFYVGTYTHGISEGIYQYKMSADGLLDSIGLAAPSENPSFLALSADKKYLIAGNEVKMENGQGSIESYKIAQGKLSLKDTHASGGAHSCYVNINKQGQVVVANYTGGNVALLQLDAEGMFTNVFDVQQHVGKGTTDRQEGPHAHSIWFVPNTQNVIAVDLGTNELWFYTMDIENGKLVAMDQAKLAMAEGAGPRHLSFYPKGKWIYVLNELNSSVSQVAKNEEGFYEIIQSISTLPENFDGFNKCADIHFSPDGKFLYASNRGHNSLVIYSVNSTDGKLAIVGFESTKGEGPRSFSLTDDGEYVLIANQNTNNIVSFKRNAETGLLTFVDEINAPTPVCVLFE